MRFITFLLLLNVHAYAQEVAFRSPMDIPLLLSGTYGELRGSHFHAGIDIKTNGVEGLRIYAVADGYVSRIRVSPVGYGKAVYINHPSGHTTVYGHLRDFGSGIAEYVLEMQHLQESFAIDVFPEPGTLPVTSGQVIGLSGNTGSSGGPHLHFEVRETESEVPLNPLHFGFAVKDNIAPTMQRLYVYSMRSGAITPEVKGLELFREGNRYRLRQGDTLTVAAPLAAFGLQAFDQQNGASNRNGITGASLWAGDSLVFSFNLDRIPFHLSRAILAHTDNCLSQNHGVKAHRLFRLPGNPLNVYGERHSGWLETPPRPLRIRLEALDAAGNIASLQFWVKQGTSSPVTTMVSTGVRVPFDQPFLLDEADVRVFIPEGVLYDTISFEYFSDGGPQGSRLSARHHIHPGCDPLHSNMAVSIRIDSLAANLQEKALIVLERDGKRFARESRYEHGWVHCNTRDFGTYYVTLDTVKPTVTPQGSWVRGGQISFTIKDNLSGIKEYRATLGEKWMLLEYDAKRNLLFGRLPSAPAGEQKFVLTVSDYCNNTYTYTRTVKF
jgi:hypothetical protein